MRIALDIWPSSQILSKILQLLEPFTLPGGKRKAPRRVAWYCLSEIFRAAATETGRVDDDESLPQNIDISTYREMLKDEAIRLYHLSPRTIPWYLRQQVLLYLAIYSPVEAPVIQVGRSEEVTHYKQLIKFLRGDKFPINSQDHAILSSLTYDSFLKPHDALQITAKNLSLAKLEAIIEVNPSLAMRLISQTNFEIPSLSTRSREDLSLLRSDQKSKESLADLVLRNAGTNPLKNEITALQFAWFFLKEIETNHTYDVISPSNVYIEYQGNISQNINISYISIANNKSTNKSLMYSVPDWCLPSNAWRYQLGYLLRFIFVSEVDFTKTKTIYTKRIKQSLYRVPGSHWLLRKYGSYNEHSAFGDMWLPISEWFEQLLFELLRWPGCRQVANKRIIGNLHDTLGNIADRINTLLNLQGENENQLILPIAISEIEERKESKTLRSCIVQTVIPNPDQFDKSDPTFDNPMIRIRHRNHLSATLASVEKMLYLRETHEGGRGRLDWLILPELSVHPDDIRTHLVPFARKYKTIILAGLTYLRPNPGHPLINSAVWILPRWSKNSGFQVKIYGQGKKNLSPDEEEFRAIPNGLIGYRPAQLLIGYRWSMNKRPLWLTGSVCYDATDLKLVSDLRNISDIFAIPAYNRDVNTFDQMALALHYHMFQYVLIANNGTFGGSNGYAPFKEPFDRQIFHLHGQPQASIAFMDIENIGDIIDRVKTAKAYAIKKKPKVPKKWKYPPAGL